MTVREMLNSASDDAIASAILRGAFKKCAYCIYDDAIAHEAGERACPNPYTGQYCREGIKKFLQSEATEPGVYQYTPEMGGAKPDCQMEASRGYYGGHWFIDTPLEIKGRGITFLKKYTDKDFCTPGHYRVGWNEYRVTNKAFDKLKEQYTISQEVCLD